MTAKRLGALLDVVSLPVTRNGKDLVMRDFGWAEDYISIATAYATRRLIKLEFQGDRVVMTLTSSVRLVIFQEFDHDHAAHHFVQLLSADCVLSGLEEVRNHLELQMYLYDNVRDDT